MRLFGEQFGKHFKNGKNVIVFPIKFIIKKEGKTRNEWKGKMFIFPLAFIEKLSFDVVCKIVAS